MEELLHKMSIPGVSEEEEEPLSWIKKTPKSNKPKINKKNTVQIIN